MGKDTYTTEITLTVPAGRCCRTKGYACRFLVGMWNHPGDYCFLIPDSQFGTYGEIRKHPKCPSLKVPKAMKGENLKVMNRLSQFKELMEEQS